MSDPLADAVEQFMDAVEQRLTRFQQDNQTLRTEMAEMRAALEVQQRAAPSLPVPGDKGDRGDPGPEGRGIVGAEQRAGDLWLRFTDGTEVNIGRVVGRDGANGTDGRDPVLPDLAPIVAVEVQRAVTTLPPPKEGAPGKDGQSVDPIQVVALVTQELHRTVTAEVQRAVTLIPVPKDGANGRDGQNGIATREELVTLVQDEFREVHARSWIELHRGVWKTGADYRRGDIAVLNGSTWGAAVDTQAQPGTNADWKLVAQKGRDGKLQPSGGR